MIFSPAYLAGSTVLQEGPYLRIVLAEFVDVGISEHTVKVCAVPTNDRIPQPTHYCSRSGFGRRSIHAALRFRVDWSIAMVKGLGTVIYHVPDLSRAKTWYAMAFQQQPYFDEPFYVGFNVGGYELGLDPNPNGPSGPGGSVAYWRVDDIAVGVQHFVDTGAVVSSPIQDVGDGIKVATVVDPFGNPIGLIENPHFALPKD